MNGGIGGESAAEAIWQAWETDDPGWKLLDAVEGKPLNWYN